jgi:8-oxo-dGTP pyrophosphatase MutT (NUDIX family)
MPDATRLSCGAILLNERDQLLLAHATGSRWWDLPKGLAEPGEAPLDAARRELLEETGIALDALGWADLGRHRYRPGKDLHLFARRVHTRDVRVEACVCASQFRHPRTGRMLPEADAFCWYEPVEVPDRCARSMTALLDGNGLLARALAAVGASVAP